MFALSASAGRLSDLAAAIHYTPPTNFYGGIDHPPTDPGDDPLSLTSPRFLHYLLRGKGTADVMFSFSLIGAYVGEGKVVHYLPVTPSLMRREIEETYRGKFPNTTPATVDTIQGLTAVNLTASRPTGDPRFLRSCWIQVETNVALKVTAVASDAGSFELVTNSLNTLRIDKTSFLAALYAKPKDADVITNHLQRVELGHVQLNGYRPGVCVFYTKERTYSFTVGQTFNPNDDLNSCVGAFEGLRNLSGLPNALRVVLIDIAPEIPQTTLIVVGETNAASKSYLSGAPRWRQTPSQDWLLNIRSPNISIDIPPVTLIPHLWQGSIPEGFHREKEYKLDAVLYIRTQPSSND